MQKKQDGLYVSLTTSADADKSSTEKESVGVKLNGNPLWLRVRIQENAVCNFSFSQDGKSFAAIGEPFKARQGRWIGATVGIFAIGMQGVSEFGFADFDWFRVE